ncbi:hypothetical protein ACLOJK_022751 [Asimina triloba]
MAESSSAFSSSFLILSLLLISSLSCSYSLSPIISDGRKVGGRSEVKNVESNQEIQSLGRFSVEEYNKRHGRHLSFSRVFKAERQVVSGIKYFLKIATVASSKNGGEQFDAVVVVKPWIRSKQLLSFAPSKRYELRG